MHLGKAVDQVRRSENRKLMIEGDTRLVGSKYLWLSCGSSINAGVQLLSSHARGFRNFANFRVAILFRYGGLNLYPGANAKVLAT